MNLNDLEHIYFCTGARNCALLDHFPDNKITFEIDERIASFKALGRKLEVHKVTAKRMALLQGWKIENKPLGISVN